MIDFNYTAPELLPFRIQEVLDAPNEPHRIGGVVYVPEGGWKLTAEQVEKAIHDCSTYASYDGCTYYASGIRLQAIADELNAELGSDAKPCYAADENYKRCKYSVNRGWCDDAPFLVWDDTGHLFITMGGLKTWDVTDDAKKWFAELGSGTCEFVVKDNMNESEGMGDVWIECSACHCQFDYYADDWLMKMSYCPNCGRRVDR